MQLSGSVRIFVFLSILVFFPLPFPNYHSRVHAQTPPRTEIEAALAAVRSAIGEFPADLSRDPLKKAHRTALSRRETLLQEYLDLLAGTDALALEKRGLEGRLKEARAAFSALGKREAPKVPSSPDRAVFDQIRADLIKKQEQVASLRKSTGELRQKMTGIDSLIHGAMERAATAEKSAERLAVLQGAQTDRAAGDIQSLELENARLENRIALMKRTLLEAETDLHKKLEPVLSAELELAEKEQELLETHFAAYSNALGSSLVSEQERMAAELTRREEAITAATTPTGRFTALWETELYRSLKNRNDMEAFLVELKLDHAEQEKRLAAEQEELAGFRELLAMPEASRKAGDRIKSTILQLKRRRLLLNRPVRAGFTERLHAFQERRYTVEDTLFSLNDRWQESLDAVVATLPPEELQAFTLRTASLLSDFRTALREEKTLLTEVITLGQRLLYLSVRRLENIDEHERFIRSRVFWLQDVKPMGIEALRPAANETLRLLKWGRDVVKGETGAAVLKAVKRPMALLSGILLLFAGPAFLLFLWRRLRRAVKIREDRAPEREAGPGEKGVLIIAGVAGPAVITAYCLFLARFMGNTGLPKDLKPVLVVALAQTGYFLFFWCLSRTLFGAHGLLPMQFNMHREGARTLNRSLRQLLFLYISLLLLWRILSQPPFSFEALPRICYTIFEFFGAMVIFRLIRPLSPWVRHSVGAASPNPVSANWRWISRFFILLIVSILFLDLAGYRSGAQSIAESSGLTLVTLMLFPSLYTTVTAYIGSMGIWQKPAPDPEAAGEPPEQQLLRPVRAALFILLLVLLAAYWGIDQQALKTLEEIHLYRMRGAGDLLEFVSAADLIRAGLYMAATFLLLRGLPGLYEYALMPRLRLDEGMKYAVLTLSRYGIFIVGLLLTLAEMHLDLGRLGWLMAAMGVGLGFGLQEIVSNFVSGIILLTERPIQVRDVITVGGISGTVRRINIRATTIVNFDRQEVILPNRSLITSEVTNWTKSDKINRLVIRIGAAYGSDVNKVSGLLGEIARNSPQVLEEPSPTVIFMQHGESSLDFDLRVFTPSPDARMETLDHINKEISRRFAEEGIEIPFPQRDLHIRSGSLDSPA